MDNSVETPITPEVSAVVESPVTTPADTSVVETPTPLVVETSTPEVVEETKTPVIETLLGEEPKEEVKQEEKTPEAPKAEEVNQEGGQSEETAPPPSEEGSQEIEPVAPTYDPFSLPEGITLQEDRIKEFTGLLAELEQSGKADHAAVQAFGQKAVDFHVNEANRITQDLTKLYQTTWEKQKVSWKEEFLADPVYGGNRFQTTVDAANSFIRTHGGTAEEQAEFRQLMESSGLGNHKAVIRTLAKAMENMGEGEPLAATRPVSAPKSKTSIMYGRS